MTIAWSMQELQEDLVNWSDNYGETVTLKNEEPGTTYVRLQPNKEQRIAS